MTTPRKFKIETECVKRFELFAEKVQIVKSSWIKFFIEYELDFYGSSGNDYKRNSDVAFKWLKSRKGKDVDIKILEFRETPEFFERLNEWCFQNNVPTNILVEYALTNAMDRVYGNDKELKKKEIMALHYLENSIKYRMKGPKHIIHFKEALFIEDCYIPHSFRKANKANKAK